MRLLPLLSLFLTASLASAADLHVNPAAGADAADGKTQPVKTIARAIRLAQPGDTIHLVPGRYFETADLTNKRGTAEQPIVLDGHGAVLDGTEAVRAADWEALGDGLFRHPKLLRHLDAAVVGRWFFLWNGRMNRMGRTSKGPSAPLKDPSELQPGEWTFVRAETAFYLRIPPGQNLDEANIRYPARGNGVVLSLEGEHLTVKNLIATHVYNDGFNIHGHQRATIFENIAAIECGDDGFSAHEDAECRIDGFVSIGNSTGLCDTVSSVTHYRNVFIRDCLGFDIFFVGDSPHSMENVVVESRAARGFQVSQHTDHPQKTRGSVRLRNLLIRRVGEPQEIRVDRDALVRAERCTFLDLNVLVAAGGDFTAHGCFFGGTRKPEIMLMVGSRWQGDGNRFDVQHIRQGPALYTAGQFGEFKTANRSDTLSQWPGDPAASGIGADDAALKEVEQMGAAIVRRWQETP